MATLLNLVDRTRTRYDWPIPGTVYLIRKGWFLNHRFRGEYADSKAGQ
jgi:hypothetical protein